MRYLGTCPPADISSRGQISAYVLRTWCSVVLQGEQASTAAMTMLPAFPKKAELMGWGSLEPRFFRLKESFAVPPFCSFDPFEPPSFSRSPAASSHLHRIQRSWRRLGSSPQPHWPTLSRSPLLIIRTQPPYLSLHSLHCFPPVPRQLHALTFILFHVRARPDRHTLGPRAQLNASTIESATSRSL